MSGRARGTRGNLFPRLRVEELMDRERRREEKLKLYLSPVRSFLIDLLGQPRPIGKIGKVGTISREGDERNGMMNGISNSRGKRCAVLVSF